MAKKTIIVAACQLVGAKDKDGNRTLLEKGEEFTAAIQKKFGLSAKEADELVASGKLIETKVREASGGDESAKAATARADKAEAALAEAQKQVEELTAANQELEKKLEEAIKPAAQ